MLKVLLYHSPNHLANRCMLLHLLNYVFFYLIALVCDYFAFEILLLRVEDYIYHQVLFPPQVQHL